ncbi:MAG: 5'-methylthioadenosine/adenosylhomocysteine nucleosidase [Ruminococcus sp.]|nr:5'-methylthioadenosine/adenosylhomocysteine nucleosidase [Ruminococcus sp.]
MYFDKTRPSIGIIGAMAEEIDAVKSQLNEAKSVRISGTDFVYGQLHGVDVVAAMSGIGKVNAAICAEAMILRFSPDCIVNIGVGGALSRELSIGSAAVADKVVEHDMDLTPLGFEAGFLPGIERVFIQCDRKCAALLEKAAQNAEIPCRRGPIASGDAFINDSASKERIAESFGAIVCEMEGGSIGHVCAANDVPFAVLRTISDNGDENSGSDFSNSLEASAEAALRILNGFLELYPNG